MIDLVPLEQRIAETSSNLKRFSQAFYKETIESYFEGYSPKHIALGNDTKIDFTSTQEVKNFLEQNECQDPWLERYSTDNNCYVYCYLFVANKEHFDSKYYFIMAYDDNKLFEFQEKLEKVDEKLIEGCSTPEDQIEKCIYQAESAKIIVRRRRFKTYMIEYTGAEVTNDLKGLNKKWEEVLSNINEDDDD